MHAYKYAVIAFGITVKYQDLSCFELDGRTLTLGEYLAGRAGLERPRWRMDHPNVISAWHRAAEDAEGEAPIEVVRYGDSHSGARYDCVIAVKGTVSTASPGGEPVHPRLATPDGSSIRTAAAFCRENEIAVFDDPRWTLAALDATECACC